MPSAGQFLGHEAKGAAIKLIGPDGVIARLQHAPKGHGDRRHAGGDDCAASGPLHGVDQSSKHFRIRVAFAGVGIAFVVPFVLRVERVRVGRSIDDRGLQGRGDGATDAFGPERAGAGGFAHVSIFRNPVRYSSCRS